MKNPQCTEPGEPWEPHLVTGHMVGSCDLAGAVNNHKFPGVSAGCQGLALDWEAPVCTQLPWAGLAGKLTCDL